MGSNEFYTHRVYPGISKKAKQWRRYILAGAAGVPPYGGEKITGPGPVTVPESPGDVSGKYGPAV